MLTQNEQGLTTVQSMPVRLDKSGNVWVLRIDAEASFEDVRRSVSEHLALDASSLHGRHLRLGWGERPLDLLDVRRLSSQLRDEYQASVIAIECTADRIHQYAEHSFKLKFFPEGTVDPVRMPLGFVAAPPVEEVVVPEEAPESEPTELDEPLADETAATEQEMLPLAGLADELATDIMIDPQDEAIPTDLPEAAFIDVEETEIVDVVPEFLDEDIVPGIGGRRVLVLDRTVRSGNVVRFAGDVTVFGDVNAGAQIEADGNIVVLGTLRGLAHAGARGDTQAVIVAFDLDASQLRIARCVGFSGDIERPASMLDSPSIGRPRIPVGQIAQFLRRDRGEVRQYVPKIAWSNGGNILIDTYDGRLPT